MKLNDTDQENIEVLEALDIDENALLGLVCVYFNYRYKRTSGKFGYSPNQALQETIRTAMKIAEEHEEQEWQHIIAKPHVHQALVRLAHEAREEREQEKY